MKAANTEGLCQCVLGFRAGLAGDGHPWAGCLIFRAQPVRVFKPLGLAIWGAAAGATVAAIICGPSHEVLASFDPVPARMFAGFESFEALKRRIENDSGTLAGWGEFGLVYPGNDLVLLIGGVQPSDADKLEVGAWGTCVVR